MELTALALLNWFVIFVVVPILLALPIAGVLALLGYLSRRRAKHAGVVEEAIGEAPTQQAAEAQGEAVSREPVKEHVQVA